MSAFASLGAIVSKTYCTIVVLRTSSLFLLTGRCETSTICSRYVVENIAVTWHGLSVAVTWHRVSFAATLHRLEIAATLHRWSVAVVCHD